MLLHSKGRPGSTDLTSQLVFELDNGTDLTALRRAWEDVIAKHDALRTGFYWTDGKAPVQFVRASGALRVDTVHVEAQTEMEFNQRKSVIVAEDIKHGIDLEKPPLMRIKFLTSDQDKKIMIWTSHHLVLDRWCTSIVLDDLNNFYCKAVGVVLPRIQQRVTGKYKSHIDYLQNLSEEQTLTYWNEYLSGVKNNRLIATRSVGEPSDKPEDLVYVHNIKHSNTSLATFARSWNVTGAQLAQLAWAFTLATLQQSNDVVFALTTSGRSPTVIGVDRIVGCFVNNVLARTSFNECTTIENLLECIKSDQVAREDFQHESISKINKHLSYTGDGVAVESLFVWLNEIELSSGNKKGLTLVPESQTMASAFPLTVGVYDKGHELSVNVKLSEGFGCVLPLSEIAVTFEEVLITLFNTELTTAISEIRLLDCCESANDLANTESQPGIRFSKPDHVLYDRADAREANDPEFLKQILTNEWKSVLNVSEFDSRRSFFELGGTSIDAAKLHVRLEAILRISLPLLQVFQKPYINDMVSVLVNGDWAMQDSIAIPIKKEGSTSPLFFVASPDVNTIGCAQLANKMKSDCPVVVLQAPPESTVQKALSPSELPECARSYIEAMKQIQPSGPYRLMGMCSGAQLTYEMAKQLETTEQTCEFIGILNTWALFTVARKYRLQQLYARFKLLKQENVRQWPAIIWRRIVLRRVWSPLLSRMRISFNTSPGDLSSANGLAMRSSMDSNNNDSSVLNEQTQAPPSEVPVDEWVHVYGWHTKFKPAPKLNQTVFVMRIPTQPFWRIKSNNLGWSLHANKVEVEMLKCDDHHALLREPWVTEIAEIVDSRLKMTDADKESQVL